MKHFTTALRMACAATNEAEGDDFQLVKEVVERSGDTRRCGVSPRRHGGAGSSTSLGEDAAGSRVSIEEDVIEYHWGKDLSGTIGGAGGVGGLLYLSISNSSTPTSSTRQLYVPWYDAYGNIMGYWDAQGNVVAEYTYDAFGKLIASLGPMADVFSLRYSTKYFDPETRFYYYGYRFYSPFLQRWLTRDPIGEEGGVNLYAFCNNSSVNAFDPFGHRRMITGVFIPAKNIRMGKTARESYLAANVLKLRDQLNSQYKNKNGGPQFNVQIKDLVVTLERLDQYKKRRSRCTIDVSIYEGDWDDFDGTTSEGLDAWEKGKKK